MKPTGSVSLAVVAVSALLLTPSTQACDDGTPVSAKAKEAASEKVSKKNAAKASLTKTVVKKNAPKPSFTKTVAQAPAAGTAGRIVTRDPETGELRAATAEEVNRLRTTVRKTMAMPTVERVLADGTVEVELGEEGVAYATLERRPDGTLKPGCFTGQDPSKAVRAPTPPKPAAEEK